MPAVTRSLLYVRRTRPILALLSAAMLIVTVPGPAVVATAATEPATPVLSALVGGNTYGVQVREKTARADGYRHVDTPTLIARLKQMHANTYTFGVWESASDWDDLRTEFAPAAQAAGIQVMVYLVPPSECLDSEDPLLSGRCSRPFKEDYTAWARNIAELSARYPVITSWAIDDFVVSADDTGIFTPEYLAQIKAITESIRPELKFYVTLYDHQINHDVLNLLDDSLDGAIYPYLGQGLSTAEDTDVTRRLDEFGPRLKSHGMELLLLVYGGRYLLSNVPPDAAYISSVLGSARPYLADGRIAGVVAYGAPLAWEYPRPSYENRAHRGSGSLSFSIPNLMRTNAGDWAQAATDITVPARGRTSVSFWHYDQNRPGDLSGYHVKQLLIDDDVVWHSDVSADPGDAWIKTTVDLSDALRGKRHATLTLRVHEQQGISWWPIDIRFDDVEPHGFRMDAPGDFERPGSWAVGQSSPAIWAKHDVFHIDEPTRIVNAFGAAYAQLQGQGFTPVPSQRFRGLKPGPDNRAMYGNGWLEFSTTGDAAQPGACATAEQRVQVDDAVARQELSWWHTDRVQVQHAGILEKRVYVDDTMIWRHDVADEWPWDYIQGSILQGPIDVTSLANGKPSVTVTLALCAIGNRTIPDIRATFDHVEAIGLDLANGGFEGRRGWAISADSGFVAAGRHAGPPVFVR